MTLRELCEVIPESAKLRIKERPGDLVGTNCLRYDVYDPLELCEMPELKELQSREVVLVRPDRAQENRLVIVLKKEKEE